MEVLLPDGNLLPGHTEIIGKSAILPDVAKARGYRSVTTKSELKRLGFSDSQSRVPALLLPVWGVSGEIVSYQIRPDEPRLRDGKPLKYETPSGSRMCLDVPPTVRQNLGDPCIPLFVTEGVRKADSAVSHGLCCIALLGVWNWRGTNELGGKTALPDWEKIALNGRRVYVAFDSDVMEKPQVAAALARLKGFLESRKADVRVIYLPPGPAGEKTGFDDFFARGGTGDGLFQFATSELRHIPKTKDEPVYEAREGGLYWRKLTREGDAVSVRLTNFTARVTGEVTKDDGQESARSFEIESELQGRRKTFTVPSGRFASLDWVPEQLGAQAIVYPGLGTRDHTRAAIQTLSEHIPHKHVYGHTGWRKIGGEWLFLHAGGAIGADGPVDGIEIDLPGAMERYRLPDSPGDVVAAVRQSLELLEVLPPHISACVLAAIYRAPLGPANFSLHLAGGSGLGKTAFSLLAQAHFGIGFTLPGGESLPGSWSSTANSLETLGYLAKDVIFGVDDFAPTGTAHDVARLHRDADRLLRGQGNQAGRQRLNSEGTLRTHRYPRGLILSTGEDVPKGESLRARMFVLETGPGDTDWAKLTGCQRNAGLLPGAMAGYVQWLAPRYEKLDFTGIALQIRQNLQDKSFHKRTPEIVADLSIGARFLLDFAEEAGAIGEAGGLELWEIFTAAFSEAAECQPDQQQGGEPARRFLDLLAAAVSSGLAHVASTSGGAPENAGSWGWRKPDPYASSEPLGFRTGWLDGDDLYLDADASFAVCQRLGRDQGDSISITLPTLKKRLHDRRHLLSLDHRGAKTRFTVRKTLDGVRRDVLHLSASALHPQGDAFGSPIDPAQVAQVSQEEK